MLGWMLKITVVVMVGLYVLGFLKGIEHRIIEFFWWMKPYP
jgi:hypothetical protein